MNIGPIDVAINTLRDMWTTKALIYCGLNPIECRDLEDFIYAEIKKNDGRTAQINIDKLRGKLYIRAMCNRPDGRHEAKIEFPTITHLKNWVESHKPNIVSGLIDWKDVE